MDQVKYTLDAKLAVVQFWWDVIGTAGQVGAAILGLWIIAKAVAWTMSEARK